jgi:hypothetical protein
MSTKATPFTFASLSAGLNHGREIADVIHIDGTDEREADKFAEESLRTQISVRERGVDRQHLDFESGFRVGLRMRLGEHALDTISAAYRRQRQRRRVRVGRVTLSLASRMYACR